MESVTVQKLTFARYGEDPPGNVYRNYQHGRGVCGIVAVFGGFSEYAFADGRRRILRTGELALFSERTAYVITNTSGSLFAHFTVNFERLPDSALPADECFVTMGNPGQYRQILSRILELRHSPYSAGQAECMAALYTLLSRIFSEQSLLLEHQGGYRSILPAIRFMEMHYGQSVTLQELAALCVMSPSHFRRIFREVTGVPPIDYLLRLRTERAAELVRHTSLRMEEIALQCGFGTPEHFCRTFRRRMGLCPGDYRDAREEKED